MKNSYFPHVNLQLFIFWQKPALQSVTTPLGTHAKYTYDTFGNPTRTKTQESTATTAK